jgi:DNA-binding transcriptional MerR regulator
MTASTTDRLGSEGVDKAPDAFRTISEVADDLKLPQHVLRFWESRFAQIRPMKRAGGRRYYRPDDVDLLRGIRHLLYGEGYTIRGVQQILKERGVNFVEEVWREGAEQPGHGPRAYGDGGDSSDSGGEDTEDDADAAPADHADREAALSPSPRMTPAIPAARREGLPREGLRRLQAALFELNECRRLLDGAGGADK